MRQEERWSFLVADDDSRMLEAVCATLTSTWPDAQITTAANGFEVIEAIKNAAGAVDLLITDIHMPGMGGLETLTAIKETYPDIRVLAVSGGLGAGFDKKPILEMAAFLGASAVLEKPFTGEELLSAARGVLARPPE